jgi:dTMP kinase
LLAAALRTQGYDVVETREPTDGAWGQRLRSLARQGIRLPAQEELQLFIQDRKEHVTSLILPKLRAGAIILQDRYFPSSMAYQGSRDLPLSAILEAHEGWAPLPHSFLFLHLPPEQALQRIKARAQQIDAFERLESLQRCDAIFEQLADLPGWHRFDALANPQSLHQAILATIAPLLPR